MRKSLHFAPSLIPLIISGKKFSTWRFWDDKNLSVGDTVDFLESGTHRHFATTKIVEVVEKRMGEITDADRRGHEVFQSEDEMYETYTAYYHRSVGPETIVKIIWFEIFTGPR